MAKKKKTQLKSVARGFATTSVPKKIATVDPETSAPLADSEAVRCDPSTSLVELSEGPQPSQTVNVPAQIDPEEEYLQACVDKYQERTEREVARAVKTIEQERRFANTLTPLQFDPTFVAQVISLLKRDDTQTVSHVIEEVESKALPRIAITYGVLLRLGFSEADVFRCLESIPSIDLDDAIDWLHVHCSEGLLRSLDPDSKPGSKSLQTSSLSSHLATPSPSVTISSSEPSTPLSSALDPSAMPFVPSLRSSAYLKLSEETTLLDYTAEGMDHNGPTEFTQNHSLEDLTSAFVQVKMRIASLTTHRKPNEMSDASILRQYQRQLEQIKNDYFFDADEANKAYQLERDKADAAALQAHLRGDDSVTSSTLQFAPATPVRGVMDVQSTKPADRDEKSTVSDLFADEDDDDTVGGLFELLEELPTTEITSQGTIVTIREMSLPKHYSGQTSKTLLEEAVRKADKYAVIMFRIINGASRAKRATVTIRWDGGKSEEWAMEDVACHDSAQAEQYVATVALHALSFPLAPGFALHVPGSGVIQSSYKLLPPAFRDLWIELEEKRRQSNNAINLRIWSRLRCVLEPKLTTVSKSNNGFIKDVVSQRSQLSKRSWTDPTEADHLKADFQQRQASPVYQEMLRRRNELPIARYRHEIVNTLETSQILVLSGETGCGKSTQLPAFILEDRISQGKPCKIICTEPRRISAISLAQRVSIELGEGEGTVGTMSSLIGYTVRLESNTSKTTRLSFVTNGIALRMLEGGSGQGGQGTAFDEITHIIIDEVHERTIESDFLLIVLKSLLTHRPDIRVVLMSATVDADKISKYFGGCPVLHVPGRTFPVDVKYLEDAVEFTGWKVTESSPYVRRGNFAKGKAHMDWSEDVVPADDEDDVVPTAVKLERRYSPTTVSTINVLDDRLIPFELIIRLLERICAEDSTHSRFSTAILVFMPGIGEIRRLNDMLVEHRAFGSDAQFRIYPLHSSIASEHQGAVFDIPPPGIRKIVIATNIAETGITIPDITCVIDSGRHREMRFDEKRQISRLVDTYVAKSNAAQRRGRAGRVQPGVCFHLFTKFRHDKMADHPDPEIMRLSLSDLALRIKIMKVNLGKSVEDVLSRALDPPLSVNIQRAVASLIEVRALTTAEEITPMGRLLSKLPTDVHLGKFLLIATIFRCLDPALTIAAALSFKSPFVTPFGLQDEADRAKLSFRNSDFLTIHNAFSTWRNACANGIAHKLCRQYFLSHQNLLQIEELRQQYLGYLIDSNFLQVDRAFTKELNRSRFTRGKPRFVNVPPELNINSPNIWLVNSALAAGLYPKVLSLNAATGDIRTTLNNQSVAFHPSSINFGRKHRDFGANHLSYFTLMHSKKLYAWETGPIDDLALALLCGEAEFKLMANMVTIDRKIKFRVEPKASIALKYLRTQLGQLFATQYRCKPLNEKQILWNDIAMMSLGKINIREPPEKEETMTLVVNRPLHR